MPDLRIFKFTFYWHLLFNFLLCKAFYIYSLCIEKNIFCGRQTCFSKFFLPILAKCFRLIRSLALDPSKAVVQGCLLKRAILKKRKNSWKVLSSKVPFYKIYRQTPATLLKRSFNKVMFQVTFLFSLATVHCFC